MEKDCPICGSVFEVSKTYPGKKTCGRECGGVLAHGVLWSDEMDQELRELYLDYPAPYAIPLTAFCEKWSVTKRQAGFRAQKLGLTNGKRTSRVRQPNKVCPKCEVEFYYPETSRVYCSKACGDADKWKRNPHPRGMAGKTHSEASKTAISEKSKQMWESLSEEKRQALLAPMQEGLSKRMKQGPWTNPYGRGTKGKREDLGGLFVRSKWEANVARVLNLLKEDGVVKEWEFEPKTFEFPVKRGNKWYTPDFRVYFVDGSYLWIEVKGWMDNNSRVKLNRFARYYPDEPLIMVCSKEYKEIELAYRDRLSIWEK